MNLAILHGSLSRMRLNSRIFKMQIL